MKWDHILNHGCQWNSSRMEVTGDWEQYFWFDLFICILPYHVTNIIGVGDGWRWRLSAICNSNIEIEYIRVGGFGLRRVSHLVASVHPDSDLPFLVFYTNEIWVSNSDKYSIFATQPLHMWLGKALSLSLGSPVLLCIPVKSDWVVA